MYAALNLWGYEISGQTALIAIGIYILLGIVLIWAWPKVSVPWTAKASSDLDERAKIMDMRSKVRASIIQVVGGIVAVAAFITTIQQIHSSDDAFNQKKADLFATHLKELLGAEAKEDARAEALYILSYVARSDRSYHRTVYEALASFVTELSEKACAKKQYLAADYHRDRTIQRAMRIIGERKSEDDPTGKRLNLERGCFVGLDLIDEWGVVTGLAKARLSGSKMLRVDFGRADLKGVQLMGIDAGDCWNPGWDDEMGRRLHTGYDGDPRVGTWDGSERRKFVAHFIDTNLEGADFGGAGLQGADFSGAKLKGANFDGAVISHTSFKGSQDLTADQLKYTCVGYKEMSEKELDLEQPYVSAKLRAEIGAHPILKGKIPRCGASQAAKNKCSPAASQK